MCLEIIKNLSEIDGERIGFVPDSLVSNEDWLNYADSLRKNIIINLNTNTVALRMQKGDIKETSHNGCRVDTLILLAMHILEESRSEEKNEKVIHNLAKSLYYLNEKRAGNK